MRKVILQIDLTLDGFAADREGKNFWAGGDEPMTRDALDVLESTDTILLGRVAYQEFIQFWSGAELDADSTIGKIAAQINRVDKLIFSRTPGIIGSTRGSARPFSSMCCASAASATRSISPRLRRTC